MQLKPGGGECCGCVWPKSCLTVPAQTWATGPGHCYWSSETQPRIWLCPAELPAFLFWTFPSRAFLQGHHKQQEQNCQLFCSPCFQKSYQQRSSSFLLVEQLYFAENLSI